MIPRAGCIDYAGELFRGRRDDAYQVFHSAAETLSYDVHVLAQRFNAGFEAGLPSPDHAAAAQRARHSVLPGCASTTPAMFPSDSLPARSRFRNSAHLPVVERALDLRHAGRLLKQVIERNEDTRRVFSSRNQCPRDRRLGRAAAVFAFAKPAIDADRRALGFFQIPFRWRRSSRRCVADFAPQPDRQSAVGLADAAPPPGAPSARSRNTGARGISMTCLSRRSGVSKVECTFHNGSAPEFRKRERAGREIAWKHCRRCRRATGKNGMPRALGRCSVVRRWQTGSKPAFEALRQHVNIVAQRFRRTMKRPDRGIITAGAK